MKISLSESQWPQIAEVWYHLNRQSVQAQHPCCPQSPDLVLLFCLLVSLFILNTFFCAWSTWTSSDFSSSRWKWLRPFILALNTLNMALHCMGGSLVHDLPSVFLQQSLLPWESRTLGHREGNSATAAGISVKEKKCSSPG